MVFIKVGHRLRFKEKKILDLQALGPNQCKFRKQWKNDHALIQKNVLKIYQKADHISTFMQHEYMFMCPKFLTVKSLDDEIAISFFSVFFS